MIDHKDDTRRLKQALAYRAEEIAVHLFGKPSSRTRVELRFAGMARLPSPSQAAGRAVSGRSRQVSADR